MLNIIKEVETLIKVILFSVPQNFAFEIMALFHIQLINIAISYMTHQMSYYLIGSIIFISILCSFRVMVIASYLRNKRIYTEKP